MSIRRALALPALALPCLYLLGCGGEEFVAGASDAGAIEAAADAGPPFCASQPAGLALCSDFDEKPLPESWDDLITKGGGPVVEDGTTSVSPPNSLLASAPALKVGDSAMEAFVSKTSLPVGAAHIAFDMRVDALSFPSTAGGNIVAAVYTQRDYEILLAFIPSSTGPFEFLLLEVTGAIVSALDAGVSSTPHDLTTLLGGSTLGSWQTFKLDLDIDHGLKAATVTVGSSSTSVPLSPPVGTAGGDRTFSLGVQATAPTGPTKFRFDNVTYSAN